MAAAQRPQARQGQLQLGGQAAELGAGADDHAARLDTALEAVGSAHAGGAHATAALAALAVLGALQPEQAAVVAQLGAGLARLLQQAQGEAGVVGARVLVAAGAPFGGQARHLGLHLRGAQEAPRAPAGQLVVDEQAGAHRQPARRSAGTVRHQEGHGPHEARGVAQQLLAGLQGFAHQAPGALLQVAQAAVHQLAAVARRARRVVVTLDQQHREPAPRRRQRHRRAADAAADHQQILAAHRRLPELKRPSGSKWAMAASIAARPAAPFSTPR
jgi:hypothetical protein